MKKFSHSPDHNIISSERKFNKMRPGNRLFIHIFLLLGLGCCICAEYFPEKCSSYDIDDSVLSPAPPEPNAKSAIGKAFASLERELHAVLVAQPSGPSCYEWKCQSKERLGEQCRWCLPSVFVGGESFHTAVDESISPILIVTTSLCIFAGIAKCGTTALCEKLVMHPDVRFYRSKETDIFTKMRFSISEFEKLVNTDNSTATSSIEVGNEGNRRMRKQAGGGAAAAHKKPHNAERHMGSVWLDCSAGAFRDLNAAAYLRMHSPDTKVVLIVRDPWQVKWKSVSRACVTSSRHDDCVCVCV
jgi:hypothetical protein